MKLQRGKFLVNNVNEIKDNNIIYLDYMGYFEYEGNAIPISRMFIEFYKEEYDFYSTNIYNRNNEEMYIYANSEIVKEKLNNNTNYIVSLANYNIDRNYTLWQYINKDIKELDVNFWWNIEGDYFIFFGEDKKDVIKYFVENSFIRDGGKEEIKKKLLSIGYDIKK